MRIIDFVWQQALRWIFVCYRRNRIEAVIGTMYAGLPFQPQICAKPRVGLWYQKKNFLLPEVVSLLFEKIFGSTVSLTFQFDKSGPLLRSTGEIIFIARFFSIQNRSEMSTCETWLITIPTKENLSFAQQSITIIVSIINTIFLISFSCWPFNLFRYWCRAVQKNHIILHWI